MTIQKPFAVVPLALGAIATGNEKASRPLSHAGEFRNPGMVWETSGASNVWARGDFGSAKSVDFLAMLQTNALAGTRYRLRLGATQADVDNGTALAPSAFTFTTPYYGAITGTTLLTAMSDGITDAGNHGGGAGANIYASTGSGTNYLQMDLGSVKTVTLLQLSGVNVTPDGWGVIYLNGAAIKVSSDGTNYTTVATISGMVDDGVPATFSIGASCRYIKIEKAGYLGIGEMIAYESVAGIYDSGVIPLISPSVTRDDGLYGSHLELSATYTPRWWRIDVSGHTGDFRCMAIVLGAKKQFSDFYNGGNDGVEFGFEDLSDISFGGYGVNGETEGIMLRTLRMTFGWMSDADRTAKFAPLVKALGVRGVALWCFDPEATVQRQDKTCFGWLRELPAFRPSTWKQDRWQAPFNVVSMI